MITSFARQSDAHVTIYANGAPRTLRREPVLLHLSPKGYRADAAPTRGILADDRAHFRALGRARDLLKVNLALETRAREPAGISGQRPADGAFSLTVVEDMLLGDVRVVIFLVRFEATGLGIEFD